MSQLTGDTEPAAVGFDDGFADGQSHAGSVDLHTLISSTIEFLEDKGLLEIVDARTAIGDADVQCLILSFRRDTDWSARG